MNNTFQSFLQTFVDLIELFFSLNRGIMNTKTASTIFGIIFIAVGILGFISNPIIYDSDTAIFHADNLHSSVHITSGILFLLFALAAPSFAGTFLKIFGIVYLLLGVLGLINIGTSGMGTLL